MDRKINYERRNIYHMEDYVTLENYYDCNKNSTKTSQLRLAIVPGSAKYFNKSYLQEPSIYTNYNYQTIIPIKKDENEDFDYCSYKSK